MHKSNTLKVPSQFRRINKTITPTHSDKDKHDNDAFVEDDHFIIEEEDESGLEE